MKLLPSPSFARAVKRLLKRNPKFADDLKGALKLLETNIFHQQLKTHKLKGVLEGSWACSVAYDLRIVLRLFDLKTKTQFYCKQSEHTTKFIKN